VWRNLHDIFLAETALQAIKHVQRGGSNTNTAVHKLAQIPNMDVQCAEDHPGSFLGHSQSGEIERQCLKIRGGCGHRRHARLNLGIGLLPEYQAP